MKSKCHLHVFLTLSSYGVDDHNPSRDSPIFERYLDMRAFLKRLALFKMQAGINLIVILKKKARLTPIWTNLNSIFKIGSRNLNFFKIQRSIWNFNTCERCQTCIETWTQGDVACSPHLPLCVKTRSQCNKYTPVAYYFLSQYFYGDGFWLLAYGATCHAVTRMPTSQFQLVLSTVIFWLATDRSCSVVERVLCVDLHASDKLA